MHLLSQQVFWLGETPPREWPSEGTIKFHQMCLKYSKEDGTVLNKITCFVGDKEKV